MPYILSSQQQRTADLYTIAHQPIAAINLMERAATSFSAWFQQIFSPKHSLIIICGNGNNGGDGLAVARLLWRADYEVAVFYTRLAANDSPEFAANLQRLTEKTSIIATEITDIPTFYSDFLPLKKEGTILIDALLGTGISRMLDGEAAQIIHILNNVKQVTRVAIDIPSGMFCDEANGDNLVFKADFTATFHTVKLAFFLSEGGESVGELAVLDIGIDDSFLIENELPFRITDAAFAKQLMKKRPRFSHKGTFGHALIIAGSYGMMGAAQLAIKACLRSGVGLVTAHIPRKGVDIIQTTCPEAVCSIDNDDYYFSEIADCSCFSAIGVGCGIAQNSLTKAALKDLLLLRRPLVLDADALNIIAANNWTTSITPNSILTPHPKEFARLFGESPNSYQQLLLLQQKAVELKCIILLKGVFTAIALPDNTVYFNTTGNNGLAKGGSGDVLTGLILGLVAQGYTPEDAARLGAYQHGRAADIAASMLGQKAMLPSDLMHYFDAATE
jgi:NAD(P)H-hydrate epimerase